MNSMKRQKDKTLKDELPRSLGAQYATGDQWRNNSRKNEETEPKQKQHPAVDATGEGSQVWCCKKQYCIGTWNVKSINQGKLEVVKQEMGRVNVNILESSQLKWTGMGEFNSDDHYIYYCGQELLRRNGVAIIVNKRVWNTVLGCKNNTMISVFQGCILLSMNTMPPQKHCVLFYYFSQTHLCQSSFSMCNSLYPTYWTIPDTNFPQTNMKRAQ